jgi:hypothetical protein
MSASGDVGPGRQFGYHPGLPAMGLNATGELTQSAEGTVLVANLRLTAC